MELYRENGISIITAIMFMILLLNPSASWSATITVFRLGIANGTSWEHGVVTDDNARSMMFYTGSGMSQMLININSDNYTTTKSANAIEAVVPACEGQYEDCLGKPRKGNNTTEHCDAYNRGCSSN